MRLQTVSQSKPKARIALQGPSSSGKTYSALLLAYGLTGAYEKIAVIDTDGACSLYFYFGPFNTVLISSPYSAQKFTDAIDLCERSGIEAIIIDSISEEWVGEGGVIDALKAVDNNASNEERILDAHFDFVRAMKSSSAHLIATIRSREGYRFDVSPNRKEVQKIGLDPVQQDNIHYQFHTVLALDMNHRARALKDRTSFYEEHGTLLITEEIASLYASWCGENVRHLLSDQTVLRINSCNSIRELLELLLETRQDDLATLRAFIQRKQELQQEEDRIKSHQKSEINGTDHLRATA